MERRDFFFKTGLAAMATGLKLPEGMATSPVHRHKPARLRPGATVGLISPGSPIPELRYIQALENMRALGLQVKEGTNSHASNGFLAGTDAQRLEDLHHAFADPEVEAVWCLRGGYGCSRLLPHIDYDLIGRHPKPFIGYSDITALHLAIHQRTGLVCFHGPVAVSEFPEDTVHYLQQVLIEPAKHAAISIPVAGAALLGPEFQPFVINPGQAEGMLTGGNLSLVAALAGTPYLPSFKNKIVFLEDIGEQPYRLDRMLYQLEQATDLAQASGIALGVFSDCNPKGDSPSFSLTETLTAFFTRWKMPVVYGLPFGHIAHQATLPYGIQARLDATQGVLTYLETAVE